MKQIEVINCLSILITYPLTWCKRKSVVAELAELLLGISKQINKDLITIIFSRDNFVTYGCKQ